MGSSLSPRTVVRRARNLPFQQIEDEVVVVTPQNSMMHRLNEVGGEIWNFIRTPRPVAEIVEHVCTTFDVDRETALADTTCFIEELGRKKLVETVYRDTSTEGQA
jgi:hypothetical protein